ncbi:MAG: hypothetical protein M1816_007291 [Peltula sp. TS41687]|nr:MAG: hypothetical protein M1816_007291 [Peltula sp. TS41687]
MLSFILVALSAALCVKAIPAERQYAGSSGTACQQLAAKFPNSVAFPNSTLYNEESIRYWDAAAILSPACIFTPKSSQDVAAGLRIVSSTKTPFAVRSGGHTPIAGAANVNNGVLIAADNLTSIELGTVGSTRVAKVGTGQRWIQVYSWLANQGLTSIGGRYATVGLGGLLTGGGINYFQSVRGWAADNVVNYEVVTAQGQILQVNAYQNPDLFWALKGGSGNFVFITRFDLAVYPLIDVYAGNFVTDAAGVEPLVKAIAAYADTTKGGVSDPLAAANPTVQYALDTRQFSSFTNLFYNASLSTAPAALAPFVNVTSPATSTVAGPRSFMGFMNETAVFSDGLRRLFRATSVKCSPAAVNLVQSIFSTEAPKLRNIAGASVTVTYQYMSGAFTRASHAASDAIGLDPADGPFIAVLVAATWTTAADDAYLLNYLSTLVERLDAASKAAGMYYPFIFLNDAGQGQRPFDLYGAGTSLPRMRAVSARYDPSAVFQRQAAGAFKLS